MSRCPAPTPSVCDQTGPARETTSCWGLIRRKECWSLSWRGWLLLVVILAMATVGLLLGVHPFLAVTHRVEAEYLVIEGWAPNYALEQGIKEFNSGHYLKVLAAGGQTLNGVNVEPGDSDAEETAKRLKWMGFDSSKVEIVSSGANFRNRTYLSGLAVRKWFESRNIPVNSINLLSVGPHARRSRLLFEKAFQGRVAVGIIAVENREYDPRRWWAYSEGVRELIGEALAYVYARVFFRTPTDL